MIEVSPGPRPGAASARADQRAGRRRRTGAGHRADQAAGRGPFVLSLPSKGVSCKWLHSELDAFERVELLRDLRAGHFDALVGVNLLREGLDLPEVSLVAILDADKEGFLRSETSLMQTIGRAARNVNAKVILYADKMTESMQRAIEETDRRRDLASGLQPPSTASRPRRSARESAPASNPRPPPTPRPTRRSAAPTKPNTSPKNILAELEAEMLAAAEALEFERAAGDSRPDRKDAHLDRRSGRRSRLQGRRQVRLGHAADARRPPRPPTQTLVGQPPPPPLLAA